VSAALQLLNENVITTKLFLLRSHDESLKGNQLWINLLRDLSPVHWIEREEWKDVHEMAEKYRQEQETIGKKVFTIYEGGRSLEAIIGAMSLADDIRSNEEENDVRFDHIFIDSGTGMTAIGTLLGFMAANDVNRKFHITQIAGNEDEFRKDFDYYRSVIIDELSLKDTIAPEYQFLKPPMNASFGAVGPQVLEETRKIARTEGILAEPLYTVKHLIAAKKYIEENALKGQILIINCGGALGLAAYQDKLAELF
jgi:1-aminocyclopropane-1-carboxylate deaminase/D-cysteine desulfhydrase-like pyridoxal-dependent ACC family enzyme